MRIITRTDAGVEPSTWQHELAHAFRRADELLDYLKLSSTDFDIDLQPDFPLLVPRPFAAQMQPGDINDPLLKQVLPIQQERVDVTGFVSDPLAESSSNTEPGIIHKYHGRLLLMLASGCAVNCRYCFRRHFPYADNRIARRQWRNTLNYIKQRSSISEVILSGGDPLMLDDAHLGSLIDQLEAIPHVKRLRIHSRLPVVIPQRLTQQLAQHLAHSRLQCTLVLHINHANELAAQHTDALSYWRTLGITLLNQSVLLRGVNDNLPVLLDLSEQLFTAGVLPYYLHTLDPVSGAAHFDVGDQIAAQLHQQMQALLPGYLVPKLVREIPGEPSKTLINLDSRRAGDYNG